MASKFGYKQCLTITLFANLKPHDDWNKFTVTFLGKNETPFPLMKPKPLLWSGPIGKILTTCFVLEFFFTPPRGGGLLFLLVAYCLPTANKA